MDRKDLIIKMRMKIGDWKKVIKLAKKVENQIYKKHMII